MCAPGRLGVEQFQSLHDGHGRSSGDRIRVDRKKARTGDGGFPLKPKEGLTRISCMRHQTTSACAAFVKESRMRVINANKLHRKSGAWGTQCFFKSGVCQSLDFQVLLRQRVAVVFRPGAISRHCLHGWAAFSPAGAGTFGLGFCHAKAGLCFQAGADVNDVALALCTAGRLILRAAGCRGQGQQ